MNLRTPILCLFWITLMCATVSTAAAQVSLMEDKPALDSVKASLQHIYNFKFEQSVRCLLRFKTKYANHPGFRLVNCIRSYWKNYPISGKSVEYEAYKKELGQVIKLSEAVLRRQPKNPEAGYFYMMANLMLARHHSEEGVYISAVGETRKAFPYIRRGFKQKTSFPDYYFSTGLYNYYRVVFPENHPVYMPFTSFFPGGNKEAGLKDLATASHKGTFTAAEARLFLCNIALRDQYDVAGALEHATVLHQTYPDNWVFSILYAESLCEAGKMEDAEKIIRSLLGRQESGALLSGHYLQGLTEKKAGKADAAKWSWNKAIMYGNSSDRMTKGYLGLSYNELAKLALEEGNKELSRKYFRMASENCSYKKVKMDARAAGN